MTEQEFQSAYEQFADHIYRLAMMMTGQKEDAEDIVQQTFLKFYYDATGFQDENHCKAWLLTVARNLAYDLLKSAERKKRQPGEWTGHLKNKRQRLYREPESGTEEKSVLWELAPKYRAVLHLFYFEGYSTGEIAGLLGISETAVRSRLTRGRKKLRQKLLSDKEAVSRTLDAAENRR